jgi:hypothetical protein
MPDVQTLTWTLESDDKEEKNYAIFISGGVHHVQVTGWHDNPTMLIEGLGKALNMAMPGIEAPE